MANENMSKFLGDWTKSITKPLKVVKKKLTPEFYLGSKANPDSAFFYEVPDNRGSGVFPYEYIGDGDLSIATTSAYSWSFNCSFISNNQIWCESGKGIVTITSAETDNYEAGEWVYNYDVTEFSV